MTSPGSGRTPHRPARRSGAPSRSPLPHRGRAWLLGVILPLAVTGAALGVIAAWVPRLPDELVTHWGRSGPDATGSLGSLLAPFAVYSAASLLVCGLFAVLTGRTAMVRRLTAGIATGMATLNAGLALSAVHSQLDAAGPADVADPGVRILLACAVAVAAGLLAATFAGADPHAPAAGEVPASAPRADLTDDSVVWRAEATVSRSARWVLLVLAAAVVALAVATGMAADAWWLAVLLLAPVPLMFLFLSWRVRVDAAGLTAVSTLGRPRQHVPAAEVERAEVVEVDPFGEFGGVGLRIAPDIHGTVGVVLRKGEAILVHRSGGRRFAITVDDAAQGAALLNSYAERARGHRS